MADLRRFFHHHIEGDGFLCFHYRHRPSHLLPAVPRVQELSPASGNEGDQAASAAPMCCGVATLATDAFKIFVRDYDGRPWENGKGELVGYDASCSKRARGMK